MHNKWACVIMVEMEEILWLLGDSSPQVLPDTMVYLIGLFLPCEAVKNTDVTPTGKAYVCYMEDMSKTNQAGLKQSKLIPKELVHHQNESNLSHCLVRLFKL